MNNFTINYKNNKKLQIYTKIIFSNYLLQQYSTTKVDNQRTIFTIKDVCNPFYEMDDEEFFLKFSFNKNPQSLDYCSPGCLDYYYDELQLFNGETSRPRERLFFSNYTHLANKLYPLPINLHTIYRPMMGFRTVAGDAREQATNFTNCPAFWNVFKVEAAVYPIDDEFNMCSDNAFYRQLDDESIDCANTERIGYFFITAGAVLIMTMYVVWFVKIFLKRINFHSNDTHKYDDEFKMFKYEYTNKTQCCSPNCCKGYPRRLVRGIADSFNNSVLVIQGLLTPLPLPSLSISMMIIKQSVLFLLNPVAEALDVVLDGIYIVRLSRILNRFWIKANLIKLMLKLYMVAIAKDVIFNFLILVLLYQDSLELSPQKNFQLNFFIKFVGFFTEDTAQSVLQYFYFEKYQMDGDIIIIVKFTIGLLVTAKSLLVLFLAYKDVKQNIKKIDYLTTYVYVLLSVVPVFRLLGLMVQANKRGSLIRAGCLEYQISFANNPNVREIDQYKLDYQQNYQWDTFYLMGRDEQKFYNENNATYKRLYVTPFNTQCLTMIDYCYLMG